MHRTYVRLLQEGLFAKTVEYVATEVSNAYKDLDVSGFIDDRHTLEVFLLSIDAFMEDKVRGQKEILLLPADFPTDVFRVTLDPETYALNIEIDPKGKD